jgi:Mce-associated membrane protein
VGTEDRAEDKPTIAGRALRALRTNRPAEAEPVAEPEPTTPVDLVKPARADAPPVEEDVALVEEDASPRRRNSLLVAAVVLVVLALAYAVVGLVVYLRGTESSTASNAHVRDDVLAAARIDIATLRTLDYRDAKAGLEKWANVTTGTFHDQIVQDSPKQVSVIEAAKRVTVGKVVAAAVTDLNLSGGSAEAIATVDTTITPAAGTSTLDRNRYHATLRLDHGVWKIADLSIVAVGLS